jgi:signal transduction histidine kinase
MGFAQLLDLDEDLDRKQQEQAQQIMHASEHLLALISQVLELSRIEAGDVTVHIEDFELSALSRECLELVAASAAKNRITIRNELPFCRLHTDKLKVKQILLNLVSNAIKYNHAGGQVILSCRHIHNNTICLQVRDTGPGIPRSRQNELFQAFNRLGRETESIEGVGIGLVISRELAQAIGGTLDFHSEEGHGSVFRVEIPVQFKPGSQPDGLPG